MEKRLIPYSVHLPEDVFLLVKQAAGERKAAGMVREAIVSFVHKRDMHDKGFEAGIDAAIKRINASRVASDFSYKGETLAAMLTRELQSLTK